jgi:hypothetical protein
MQFKRRTSPWIEDRKLWSALSAVQRKGLIREYAKLGWVGTTESRKCAFYAPATIVFLDGKMGAIEYKEKRRLNGDGINQYTKDATKKRIQYYINQGIPYLIISNKLSPDSMEIWIRRWIIKEKKNE